jgi:hypothetical protein
MGAAWITVISETFMFVMLFLFARKAYRIRLDYAFLGRLAVPTVLAAVAVAATSTLRPSATAATALAVFLVGVVATRVVTSADVKLVLGR